MIYLIIALIASTLRLATPLILSALGGVFSEKSGTVNIALEGIMINGAFFAVLGTHYTGNPWIGVLCAVISGTITALLLGVIAIHLQGDQTVAGVAINLFAVSITAFLLEIVWHRSGQSDTVESLTNNPLGMLEKIPVIGDVFAGLTPFVYIAFIAVLAAFIIIYKTPFGLRMRSVGEHPQAADTVGINVYKTRYICLMISGALGGLSGASLSLGTVSMFREGMTSGKGYIALAAVIFGKWHPIGAFAACLFFGFTEALQIQADTLGLDYIPSEFLSMLPYVATIIVLAGFIGKSVGPKSSGKPYKKGSR